MHFLVSRSKNTAVILIGKGLIGEAIYKQLNRYEYEAIDSHRIDWSSPSNLSTITSFIQDKVQALDKNVQFNIIWSAGIQGFNANESDIWHEQSFFNKICHALSNINILLSEKPRFFLFSSIGGLFEGQSAVSDKSIPKPLRPYGELKLYQEQKAIKVMTNFNVVLLRLSSVYGPIRRNMRMGLIQVLILNGLLRKNSIITGTLATLRDYIFVDDVARFVIDLLSLNAHNSKLFHLASGKPSSILEIKHIVERLLSRSLLLSFSKGQSNTLDIPCVMNSYRGLWLPSSLEVNIERIYQNNLICND